MQIIFMIILDSVFRACERNPEYNSFNYLVWREVWLWVFIQLSRLNRGLIMTLWDSFNSLVWREV